MVQALSVPRVCQTCGGKKYLLDRQGDRAVAKVCGCSRPCPLCKGEGYVLSQSEATFSARVGSRIYDVLTPCACKLLEKRVHRFNDANVPGVLARADFDGYIASSIGQDRALQAARSFAHTYRRDQPSKGFVLSGPVGTGKTHLLAASITHLVLELGVQARYVEISLLYAQIRRGFQDGKSGGEIIGPLSEVQVLAIDELGKGRGSPFELETLDELIARRYNAGRTTLFATNYSLDYDRAQGAAPAHKTHTSTAERGRENKDGELLRERTTERIYSRLMEMCEFVQMPPGTPDMRRTKHELRGRS